jgi:dTDP-4-amino-4,6-dideoxygalactose transaminase
MSAPDITQVEREAVARVLDTLTLSMGPEVEAFEEAVRRAVGARHAIAVSSGTAGLHLAVRALGLQTGDLVLTTPFSFVASANVLLYEGVTPVFVDVEPATGNIDTGLTAAAVTDLLQGGSAAARWMPPSDGSHGKLRAILPVDVFGQPADFDRLSALAAAHGLHVLEDSCEALGARYRGRAAGTLGDIGVFAFYPNKQITTGEGGLVVTEQEGWADTIRSLRNQGRAPGDAWLDHTHLGYNYRMDELSAALGRAQMGRFEELLAKRERVAGWYTERLAGMESVEAPLISEDTTRMSWFVFVVRLPAHAPRRAVVERLAAQGIPSRPYFTPIHLQPFYANRFGYTEGAFPVVEELGRRSLALPFSSIMTEAEVERVCVALEAALAE